MSYRFYEFSEAIVERGLVPAQLCYDSFTQPSSNYYQMISLADRIFVVVRNEATDTKNRHGRLSSKKFISNEDILFLKLQALPLR